MHTAHFPDSELMFGLRHGVKGIHVSLQASRSKKYLRAGRKVIRFECEMI